MTHQGHINALIHPFSIAACPCRIIRGLVPIIVGEVSSPKCAKVLLLIIIYF